MLSRILNRKLFEAVAHFWIDAKLPVECPKGYDLGREDATIPVESKGFDTLWSKIDIILKPTKSDKDSISISWKIVFPDGEEMIRPIGWVTVRSNGYGSNTGVEITSSWYIHGSEFKGTAIGFHDNSEFED